MRHSKLKLYVDIARAVTESGPLNLDQITTILKVDSTSIKEHLHFLVSQGMIKEERTTYRIAPSGTKVLKFFKVQPAIKTANSKPNPKFSF
jgi:predicted transcriptional regulator